ncbi:cubilin [Caerostris extrusa]|uniref:Cubilin n=1 Tax=Caerostris extrusa TaxID=172846 RepID=A0AAV4YC15_CAEEX|nr:cubilin [Caerostris extrusa]
MTAPQGSIVSPNYPQPYPMFYNADCQWLIQVSAGSLINLAMVSIDIEEHRTCLYDYLQIFDGPTENSKSLLRICNNQQNPGSITSSGNSLFIRFRSDFSEQSGGFHLVYQTLCNNNLTSRRGVIESPNFPNTYPHNHNCTWKIEAPKGSNISLAFSHLFLEGGDSCDADYIEVLQIDKHNVQSQLGKYCGNEYSLTTSNTAIIRLVTDQRCDLDLNGPSEVYGGEDEHSPRLLNLCHTISGPQVVTSHGSHMLVTFNSDFTITRRGFKATFKMKPGGCGGRYTVAESSILSPNFPNPYNANDECEWLIQVDPNHLVELNFYDFNMPDSVYDGENTEAPVILKIWGSNKPEEAIHSTGNKMLIRLVADGNNVAGGFRAHYNTACGGRFLADDGGVISSPNYPDLSLSMYNCSWIIYASDPGQKVSLIITHLFMPYDIECSVSSLRLYDGDQSDSPLLQEICGTRSPPPIMSRGSILHVVVTAGIFRATYGMGATRKFMSDAELNFKCSEEQIAEAPTRLYKEHSAPWISRQLRTGFGVRLDDRGLAWEQSASDFRILCSRPNNVTDAHKLWIKFRSDDIETERGFLAHFELQHNGILNGTEGEIASPGFPFNYQMDDVYRWTVYVPSGMFVSVRFLALSITAVGDGNNCVGDIKLFDGISDEAPVLGQYCGFQIPEPIVSTGNVIHVTFTANRYYKGNFHLKWTAVSESGIVVNLPDTSAGR